MSARSQASCRLTKLRLAAARKPSESKPAGMPQFCEPASAEPMTTPLPAPPFGRLLDSGAAPARSHGRAEASLPTWSGLYWRAMGADMGDGAPAPWKASGLLAAAPAAGLRERITMLNTTKPASTSKAISRNCPNAAPRPSEFASQARPRPAARPPSMAPQGFLGAAAAPAAAGAAGFAAAALAGAACVAPPPGAASRCVTLPDCRPMDEPPPRRLASASRLPSARTPTRTTDQSFIMLISFALLRTIGFSTLDSNMQGHDAACHVVIIHMPKAIFFHEVF